ncbi:MAG TPA: hypothetical protein VFJ82_11755 [Longimicrobium sp.]|nr:hypothetical protein [Longimicrobium sp.]
MGLARRVVPALAPLALAIPAAAQTAFQRVAVLVPDAPLGRVTAAAFDGAALFVVTAEPATIHRAEGTRLRLWGAPGRLQSPADPAWTSGRLLVRDARRQTLESFTPDGRPAASRPLPGPIATWTGVSRGDTLVSLLAFRSDSAAVVRLRGAATDTLLRFVMPHPVRLMARGSPAFSVAPPFAPTPAWTSLPAGGVAFWDGRSSEITLLDARGRRSGRLRLPRGSYPVTPADREGWLADAIPREFMGQRVFEPLRAKARAELGFPATLPAVLALLPDPARGVWVQRTPASSGEVWAWVEAGGLRAQVRLPPGRELLAVGPAAFAVRARGGDGHDSVELYRRPPPGGAGTHR